MFVDEIFELLCLGIFDIPEDIEIEDGDYQNEDDIAACDENDCRQDQKDQGIFLAARKDERFIKARIQMNGAAGWKFSLKKIFFVFEDLDDDVEKKESHCGKRQ